MKHTSPSPKKCTQEEDVAPQADAPLVADVIVPLAEPADEKNRKESQVDKSSSPMKKRASTSPTKRAREEDVAPPNAVPLVADVVVKLAGLQNALNRYIDPEWRKNRTPDDWALAVTLECAELIDSYPWKWWKGTKSPADFDNIKIELVDILHFALSGCMQVDASQSSTEGKYVGPVTETPNAIATFREVIRLADRHAFPAVTAFVVRAASELQFNLVAYYVAKHTLNHIRQLGGYKEGTYKKVNDEGLEDNALLHKCIADVPIEDVTQKFTEAADVIIGRVYDAFAVDKKDRNTVASWLQVETA
jgi:dUTP pyrophosphatase